MRRSLTLALTGLVLGSVSHTEEVAVAVAANFVMPVETLVERFTARHPHTVTVIKGSTGGLYAQILNGAPYDVFIAADQSRPRLLAASQHALAETQFTIALGRLALWSRDAALVEEKGLGALEDEVLRHLAIANPDLAPYGAAARQTLESLGLWEKLYPGIVRGQNVAQAYAMVATGNAEMGLIALSQALANPTEGHYFVVPETLHAPLRQDAVLLTRGRENVAALMLLEYLSSEDARAVIGALGYGVPE
jgi:molybdate transport system substrate-binding protein